MAGKTCIVTGANAGIGKMSAQGLARLGARVFLICRSLAKAESARSEIEKATGSQLLETAVCDFAKQDSIRACAEDLLDRCPRIDVLLNNAGAVFAQHEFTAEGYEQTFAVNHLGYYLFTRLLLDRILQSAPARIVNVSSGSHYAGRIDFEDLHFRKRDYHIMRAYEQSKLGNVLFTYELDRRLRGTGVTANCLHPGVVRTGIGNKSGKWLFSLAWSLFKPFMINPEKGAATSIYLASSPDVEGVSGKYYENCKEKRSSEDSHDAALAEKLWKISAEMTGLEA